MRTGAPEGDIAPLSPLNFTHERTRNAKGTDILLERGGREPDAAVSELLMRFLLVYPEVWVAASVFIEEEVAKRRMVEAERSRLVFWDFSNSMEVLERLVNRLLWKKELAQRLNRKGENKATILPRMTRRTLQYISFSRSL